jgi:hypothetical protein
VYKLSKVGQAIDKDDLSAAGDILGSDSDAPWVQNVNGAFSKVSSGLQKAYILTVDLMRSVSLQSVLSSDFNQCMCATVQLKQ